MTWRDGEVRLYRWASSFSGSPSWLVLLALGWRFETVDERYGNVLMSRPESGPDAPSTEAS